MKKLNRKLTNVQAERIKKLGYTKKNFPNYTTITKWGIIVPFHFEKDFSEFIKNNRATKTKTFKNILDRGISDKEFTKSDIFKLVWFKTITFIEQNSKAPKKITR